MAGTTEGMASTFQITEILSERTVHENRRIPVAIAMGLRLRSWLQKSDDARINASAEAHEWRRAALRGEIDTRGLAHEHEVELRRRFGTTTKQSPQIEIEPDPQSRQPFWKIW